MAPRRRNEDRDRLDLRADREWIARVAAQSERLGISISAYIRQAVTRQLERDESERPAQPRRKKSTD
jgi:predicted HicB family RNase H-like nuclease